MAGSDVVAVFITADTNAADSASISANERPNTDFTIGGTDASGGTATFAAARIVTATTAGTGDSGKTVTITGTDVNGVTQTETITLPGSATTRQEPNSLRLLPQRVLVHNQRLMFLRSCGGCG